MAADSSPSALVAAAVSSLDALKVRAIAAGDLVTARRFQRAVDTLLEDVGAAGDVVDLDAARARRR